jgi:hypothetical protein
MTVEVIGLDELQKVYPAAQLMSDGGITYIYLPELKFVSGQETQVLQALLCPELHSGYSTRLFLEKPLNTKCANWTQHTILNRAWHTWSWNNIAANQPALSILANHMRALK